MRKNVDVDTSRQILYAWRQQRHKGMVQGDAVPLAPCSSDEIVAELRGMKNFNFTQFSRRGLSGTPKFTSRAHRQAEVQTQEVISSFQQRGVASYVACVERIERQLRRTPSASQHRAEVLPPLNFSRPASAAHTLTPSRQLIRQKDQMLSTSQDAQSSALVPHRRSVPHVKSVPSLEEIRLVPEWLCQQRRSFGNGPSYWDRCMAYTEFVRVSQCCSSNPSSHEK